VSSTVTGRVIDGTNTGIANLHVVVRDDSGTFDIELNHDDTNDTGNFTIDIPLDTRDDTTLARTLSVYITTQGGATTSMNVMQLQLDVPKKYDATPAN
jgi:hypothetical protein